MMHRISIVSTTNATPWNRRVFYHNYITLETIHILLMKSNQWITNKYHSIFFHYQGMDISPVFDLRPLCHSFLLCYLFLRRMTISVNLSALPNLMSFFFSPFCNSFKNSLCTVQPKNNARARTSFCVRKPATSCGFLWSLALGCCETQELLCGRILEMQELLCGIICKLPT